VNKQHVAGRESSEDGVQVCVEGRNDVLYWRYMNNEERPRALSF
jgi:hypothetical protein